MRLSKNFVLAGLVLLVACGFAYAAAEGKFERSLTVTGPVDLDVSTGSGRIDIRVGGSSAVQVYGLIRARNDWRGNAEEKVRFIAANPPIEQTGNTIRIGRIDDEAYRNNVSINYEIVVPAETRIRSHTGSGSQKIEGVHGPVEVGTGSGSIAIYAIGGDVRAETGSGRIDMDQIAGDLQASTGSGEIRALRIAGAIRTETGSGSITAEQTSAERRPGGEVEVSTGSGSIDVSGVDGPLRAESGSGSITIAGKPSGSWKVDAGSGGVTLHLGSDASFDLYAHAHSGQITVDHPLTMTGAISKREVRGKVRSGGSLVDVRSGSGGITIR